MRRSSSCLMLALWIPAVAAAQGLLQKGERLVREGRELVARGNAKTAEGQKLIQLFRSKQREARDAMQRAVRMQTQLDDYVKRGKDALGVGASERRQAEADIASARRQIGELKRRVRAEEEKRPRARDLQTMGRDELGKGGYVSGNKLLEQGLAQERSIAFRIDELQRDLRKAHELLLRAVNRLRQADSKLFMGKALQAQREGLRKAAAREMEKAKRLEKELLK